MRDPKEMAREWMSRVSPAEDYDDGSVDHIAALIREAQEDGAKYANLHCRMDRTKRLRTMMRLMGVDVDRALTLNQLEDMMDQTVANLIKRAEVAEAKVLVLQQEIATSHFYLNQLR